MNRRQAAPEVTLAELFHRRWAIPVLAVLHSLGGGGKLVVLFHRLRANRDSLVYALESLINAGFVARNPGYGHPMRPEYVCTPAGRVLAGSCGVLMAKLKRMGIAEVAMNKWSLPVVYATATTDGRFNTIKSALPDITPRALAQALRDVQNVKLITRMLVDDDPPRTEYLLTDSGRELVPVLKTMLKCG